MKTTKKTGWPLILAIVAAAVVLALFLWPRILSAARRTRTGRARRPSASLRTIRREREDFGREAGLLGPGLSEPH